MRRNPIVVVSRSIALCFGVFAGLNVAGEFAHRGFDANIWWLDLRMLPAGVAAVLMLLVSFALCAFAVRPAMGVVRRRLTLAIVAALLLVAVHNVVQFYVVWLNEHFSPGSPVPLSLIVAVALWLVLRAVRCATPETVASNTSHETHRADLIGLSAFSFARIRRAAMITFTAGALACLFALLQMVMFGKSDYRRPADVAVVLGARAYADGRPSDALADRVRTACELYHDGLVAHLLFSGGPGDGDVHETEAMRRLAIELDVPADAITLDPRGRSTQATVDHTLPLLDELGARRVLVVSHFYHLPRIKLAYQRARREVFTVPATERYTLTALPAYMAREVAAWWWYYARPVL